MDPQKWLKELADQLELLTETLNQSPYISREERLGIGKEITDLATRLHEGEITCHQGEKTLVLLNKRAAVDEISNLTAKISNLNPSSPRIENLRSLEKELHSDAISPEQARKKLQELMLGHM